ncbi:MAG: hypothetical protein R6U50_17670 [Desulfobacterales bacterium]
MAMIPCGVAPRISDSVRKIIDSSADIIGNFEANRFRLCTDQDLYDIEDTDSGKQMLHVALSTVAHIWNALMPSSIAIDLRRKLANGSNPLVVQIRPANHANVREVCIMIKDNKDAAPEKETAPEPPASGKSMHPDDASLICSLNQIVADPFAVAGEIFRNLTTHEWETFKLLTHRKGVLPFFRDTQNVVYPP